MKKLIVNADDLGADEARNAGIFEAIERGAVTSVSILPNGIALDDALSRIRSLNRKPLSLGIHFNLSEGSPVSSRLNRIAGPNNTFLGKQQTRQLLLQHGDEELEYEVGKEMDAQISLLHNSGIRLDHLDGHQHVHLFPAARKSALRIARENSILWFRIPDEDTTVNSAALTAEERDEAAFFSRHAEAARLPVGTSGLRAPNQFRGLLYKGKLPAAYWEQFLEQIPHGITELMVHPGHAASPECGPFSRFSTPDRDGELISLIDGRFHRALSRSGVELSGFPEVPVP